MNAEATASAAAIVADSVTHLDLTAAGRAVVCGSHGGAYVAAYASRLGVAAIVLSDAGGGREDAGVAGLELLEGVGIAAAAAGHLTARIGDGADLHARGRLTHVNRLAADLGCEVGITVAAAAELLAEASGGSPLPEGSEASFELEPAPRRVWALDSIALVAPEHADAVVMSGSHGGLLGGRPEAAMKHDALAAVFNDAGGGIEDAGHGRLGPLADRGIPAAVVDAFSARIGDARSTYEDGVVAAVNAPAAALGAEPGISSRKFAALVHEGGR